MKKLTLSMLDLNESNMLSTDEKKKLKGGIWYCPPWDPYCCPSDEEGCLDYP